MSETDSTNPNVAGNDDYASHVEDTSGQNSPQVEAAQPADTVLPSEPLYDETVKASEVDTDEQDVPEPDFETDPEDDEGDEGEVPDEPDFHDHDTDEFDPDDETEPDFDADETQEDQS